MDPEGTSIKKQEQTTTKQPSNQKIHVNELHTKLDHTGEDRIRATAKHLNYRIKGALEIRQEYDMVKIKRKFLHKVAEEQDLKPSKMIYLSISSQKTPSYGGSNSWILIQD